MTTAIGIVGAGAIAKEHARAAKESNIPVKYIVDVDAGKAAELASVCGAVPLESMESLLSAEDQVDAVVVAVPNKFHMPLAIQALNAGKDVLLEKPMGLNVAECEAINAAATASDRLVQVGLVNRYSMVGHAAKEAVGTGRLGEIYHAKALLYRRRGVPGLGGWFTNSAVSGGGALIDIGVHAIDLAMHLMDFPKVKQVLGKVYNKFGCRMENYVYESMWAGPPRLDGVCDVDDSAHAMIVFENGASLDVQVTWAGNFPEGSVPESMLGFFGNDGGMTFDLFGNSLHFAEEQNQRNVDSRVLLKDRDAMVEQMKDFVQAIETRKIMGASGSQAMEVQRVIDAVYRSSELSEAVTP